MHTSLGRSLSLVAAVIVLASCGCDAFYCHICGALSATKGDPCNLDNVCESDVCYLGILVNAGVFAHHLASFSIGSIQKGCVRNYTTIFWSLPASTRPELTCFIAPKLPTFALSPS